jgi:hypothetical protein
VHIADALVLEEREFVVAFLRRQGATAFGRSERATYLEAALEIERGDHRMPANG